MSELAALHRGRWAALKGLMMAALGVATLGGCAGLVPAVGPAPDLYDLTPKSTFRDDLPDARWQLVIEEPLAGGGLDNNRIALRPSPTEIKYFAQARWTERAPTMIQTLLVESFENTGKIVAVGRQAIGLRSDFDLKTELREFQAEYFDGKDSRPTVHVRINAKLIKQPRQSIVASQSFESQVTAEATDLETIVPAFDEALGRVLKNLVAWVLVEASKNYR